MEELKKCPCCGGEAEIKISESVIAYMGNVYTCHVGCKECGLGLSENFVDMGLVGEIEEVLADQWNRRAPQEKNADGLGACPHCGSENVRLVDSVTNACVPIHYVICRDCECRGASKKSKEQAIKTWNRRVKDD